MKTKYIACIFLAFVAIIGINVFAAKRDAELLKAAPTLKERYCASLPPTQFHPDCDVE
jgi:hypothetical protein